MGSFSLLREVLITVGSSREIVEFLLSTTFIGFLIINECTGGTFGS